MTKDKMRVIAKIYGFDEWAILGGKDIQFLNDEGINLIIHENGDFELKFKVPKSLSILELSAGSVEDLAFFAKHLNKFKSEICRLTEGEVYGNFN